MEEDFEADEEQMKQARASDISLHLKVFTHDDAPPTAGEPVLLHISYTNISDREVYVTRGEYRASLIYLTVLDASGYLIGKPPYVLMHGGFGSMTQLAPGERYRYLYHPEYWPVFAGPETYTLRLQLFSAWDWPSSAEPWAATEPCAEDRVTLGVLPYDPERLEARCQQLYEAYREPSRNRLTMREIAERIVLAGEARLPSVPEPSTWKIGSDTKGKNVIFHALLSVRDEIALPYFERLMQTASEPWRRDEIVTAIRRIDTERSRAILARLGIKNG